MLLCLVIVVHKWQKWTGWLPESSGGGRRLEEPECSAAAAKNASHTEELGTATETNVPKHLTLNPLPTHIHTHTVGLYMLYTPSG